MTAPPEQRQPGGAHDVLDRYGALKTQLDACLTMCCWSFAGPAGKHDLVGWRVHDVGHERCGE